jgi:hypothetical protein
LPLNWNRSRAIAAVVASAVAARLLATATRRLLQAAAKPGVAEHIPVPVKGQALNREREDDAIVDREQEQYPKWEIKRKQDD